VGYVGNHAIHQLNNYDINPVPTNLWGQASFSSNIPGLRTYPGWGTLAWWLNNGSASYNALQVLAKYQISKLQIQAAYTWGHSIGDITDTNSSGGTGWESYTLGTNPSLDRGNTSINRPQIFVANAVCYLPELKGQNEMVRQVAGGWELAAITQYASGSSLSFYQNGITDNTALLATPAASGQSLAQLVGIGGNGNPPLRPLLSGQSCYSNLGGSQVLNPGV